MCLSVHVGFVHMSLYTCVHIRTLSSLEPVKSPSREGLQGNQFIDTCKAPVKGSRGKKP